MIVNIMKKLQQARLDFTKLNIKKSGYNSFHKFAYFELEDIMPHALHLFEKYNLFSQITINSDCATLRIYDMETSNSDPSFLAFEIHFPEDSASKISAKMNSIQQTGAMVTYLRKYLYMLALEFYESDVIDSMEQEQKPDTKYQIIQKFIDAQFHIQNSKANEVYMKVSTSKDLSETEKADLIKLLNTKSDTMFTYQSK